METVDWSKPIVVLILSMLSSSCAIRDLHRNGLCDASGGASIFLSAKDWKAAHETEVQSIMRIEPQDAYRAIGSEQSETRLNSRFTEEIRFSEAGAGITEHDFRLVDAANRIIMAKWVRYYTGGFGRSIGTPLVSMADSCFRGAKEYLQLREELQNINAKNWPRGSD